MILVITGLMASGKSTVADRICRQLPRAVHLRGDVFRKMIVSGREDMTDSPSREAERQLALRYALTADAAKRYDAAGFTVVVQDNYYGQRLPDFLDMLIPHTTKVYVLCPDADTIARREAERPKRGYTGFDVKDLYDSFMKTTPRIGLWVDNSRQTPDITAKIILADAGIPEGS